jgi:hypothetical protein
MNRRVFPLLLVALLVALAAPRAFATPASFTLRAEVDFDFHVGNKRMPKGDYRIESVNNGLIRVTNVKSGKSATIPVVVDKMTNKPKTKLGFRRYGDQYFLRRIWDGQNEILEIKRSKAEKKAAKAVKGNEDDEGDEVDKG